MTQKPFPNIIGMTPDTARAQSHILLVVKEDGISKMTVANHNANRLKVDVANGVISAIHGWG